MEKYTFEGVTYNVAPNRLEEFLQKYPNAAKVEEGKTIDSSMQTPTMESNAMGLQSGNGFLELPKVYKGNQEITWEQAKQDKELYNSLSRDASR